MAESQRDTEVRIRAIAQDRTSGASALTAQAIVLLRQWREDPNRLHGRARELARAQPTMGSIWRACAEALVTDPAERFARHVARVERAGRALTRQALDILRPDSPATRTEPLHLVTLSSSRTIHDVVSALSASSAVRVSLAVSGPGREGVALAGTLSADGVDVHVYGDNAIALALDTAQAVVVGADAVTPRGVINKVGTAMLAAAAANRGVPVFVLATRDKLLPEEAVSQLRSRSEEAAEIWPEAPAGIAVHNAYFETTSLDLVTALITDADVLGTDLIADACDGLDPPARQALRRLL